MSPNETGVPVGILAAGEGSRLWQGGYELPKPCVPLLGRSLAEWGLRAFLAAGATEFRIALGCNADAIRDHYEGLSQQFDVRLTFVEVPQWRRGNGLSALAIASSFGDEPFLLAMADHIFSPTLVRKVLSHPPVGHEVHLAVDRRAGEVQDLDDLTKVRLDGRHIVAIGKELEPWDAGDTGLFYCSSALARGLVEAQVSRQDGLTDGVRECAQRREVVGIELGPEHEWVDIDTRADLLAAEKRGFDWLDSRERRPAAHS